MGHTRLAVLDLTDAGAQPMVSADGVSAITFNGEIYNFRALAKRYSIQTRTGSDTEVLLHLLRSQGANAVHALRGMFAFAYWDGSSLLLVRDRVGIKPLFYASSEGSFGAASELSALLATGIVPREPDYQAIDDYLCYLYVPPPRTAIRSVRQLPPGHMLRWTPGGTLTVERYWSPPAFPQRSICAEELRESLTDSVSSHLVSDAPVGVFLSGGLDSASILALAARSYPGTLSSFTVTFGQEGNEYDERTIAKQLANHYGTRHHEVAVKADVANILPRLVERFGQPFGNPTAVLSYALSEVASSHVKVVLAGDGGDELLGGYPRYQGLWLMELYRRMPRLFERGISAAVKGLAPMSLDGGLTGRRMHRFVAQVDQPSDTTYYRWQSFLSRTERDDLFEDRARLLGASAQQEDFQYFEAIRAQYSKLSMRDAAPLLDLETFLPQNVLQYGDRMSMAHGLEVRVPFCDHLLVERLAAASLPDKMSFGVQKGLFRWAMRPYLPTRILLHRKVGFNPPIGRWLRKDLAPLMQDYLGEDAVRARGLFKPAGIRLLRQNLGDGSRDVALTIWSLIVLEAWMRWLEVPHVPSPDRKAPNEISHVTRTST